MSDEISRLCRPKTTDLTGVVGCILKLVAELSAKGNPTQALAGNRPTPLTVG
jgi:hypothetical protein